MARIDKTKEEIGWLKVVFTLLVAIDVSLIAWVAQNASDANEIPVAVALPAMLLVSFSILVISHFIHEKIQSLGDL